MAYILFEEVIELIEKEWVPKGENIDQHCNRDDLLGFLKYELKKKKIPFWLDEKKVELTKIGEGGFFDIGVDKNIVIGFMMGLSRQEHSKALVEHIKIHIKEGKDMIIVLLGEASVKIFKSLEAKIEKLPDYNRAITRPRIRFIHKCIDYAPKSESAREEVNYEGSSYYG